MTLSQSRSMSRKSVLSRKIVKRELPRNPQGQILKVSQYFGENVFQIFEQRAISDEIKDKIRKSITLDKQELKEIAQCVLDWAIERGVTHFCHWFQPLTGSTAEKHDAFLDFDGDRPIERLSASQLIQGEPDASSFPSGAERSTFEARGYTTWNLTSPIFIREALNGKTLCIPTAFVSYNGNALDVKTPLLRSVESINVEGQRFLKLNNVSDANEVKVTCGAEQEYFLVDKNFYFLREDLVMAGRTLLGAIPAKNQQLEDHYFSTIPRRVLAFMQDCEVELYRLGIAAKTRHNEVAPGQFEIASIFRDANISADQNQLLMSVLKNVASNHGFICLFHEKPFEGINGSGKHLNWSVADNCGRNLLEPGDTPHENWRFLSMVAIICEAVRRHEKVLRASIASHGNDHRLGANEAPPSIISIFLGDTITKIMESIAQDSDYNSPDQAVLDMGSKYLAQFFKDNTDRNRTSPFAFTGNKFEFRAVGSSAAIGYPLAMLNAAVADVWQEANDKLESFLKDGTSLDVALKQLVKHYYNQASSVVFNGDGYSQEWVEEAQKRGLSCLRTTADALEVYEDKNNVEHLLRQKVYSISELQTLSLVATERYVKHRKIELEVACSLFRRHILPAALKFREQLLSSIHLATSTQLSCEMEKRLYNQLNEELQACHNLSESLEQMIDGLDTDDLASAKVIAHKAMPAMNDLRDRVGSIETMVPDEMWPLPTYFDLLYIR